LQRAEFDFDSQEFVEGLFSRHGVNLGPCDGGAALGQVAKCER
jgi:hypothetical protein